jgi:hypothetical protein
MTRDELEAIALKDLKGNLVGRLPEELAMDEWALLGHEKQPLLKVIRSYCIERCAGQKGEVRKCVMHECPLWPYRMGTNPFRSRCDNPKPPANDNQYHLEDAIRNAQD